MKNHLLKQVLIAEGMSPEKADEILKKAEETRKTEENQQLKVSQVSEILKKRLDKSWNEAKVRRFIASGDLPTINQVDRRAEGEAVSTKHGHRIHVDRVETFIEEQRMTKEDWKAYAKELEKRLEQYESPKEEAEIAPEGQLTIDAIKGVSIQGEDDKNQNSGHSEASVNHQLDLTTIKITNIIRFKEISKGLYNLHFKLNGEKFTGRVNTQNDVIQLLYAKSTERKRPVHIEEASELQVIMKHLLPKIQEKLKQG
ncbi:hypothetical protein [Peribacillus sp. AS_2]|uniref:hypothetical protein n=1 Tax=Peribacillus sp. AS_2 TaxID=2996755 RepID=UPI0022A6BD2F|nr:hypothetical protein [Peribacillus sp. AS_2]MCZ0875634.1 hypothetical protein [Peribacillus sp. AS_2]